MIADLLKLAEFGRNMELYNGLQMCQVHEHQLDKQHQHTNHNQFEPDRAINKHHQPLSTQCKPLDLSVKRRVASSTSSRSRLHSQKQRQQRQNQVHLQLAVKNELKQQQQQQIFPSSLLTNQSLKLITSSTYPSSCSTQSNGTSSICSLDANHQTPSMKVATLLRAQARNTNYSQSSTSIMSSNSSSDSNEVISTSETKVSQTINQNGRRQKHKGVKSHLCLQCGRSFSRSDMLTRHSRLHSGLKPYQCGKCKQVFSRSDHLSTHERTHTGEKPYQCEQCAYSACRRDMITRHMRTHSGSSLTSQQQQLHLRESSSSAQLMLSSKRVSEAAEDEEEEDDEEEEEDGEEDELNSGELLDSSSLSGLEEDE